jgi:hypothetical protein
VQIDFRFDAETSSAQEPEDSFRKCLATEGHTLAELLNSICRRFRWAVEALRQQLLTG